jgi:mRNA interferase YafQ
MYKLVPTKQYIKDVKKLKKNGYDISKLIEVEKMLARGEQLPKKYHDHGLLRTT